MTFNELMATLQEQQAQKVDYRTVSGTPLNVKLTGDGPILQFDGGVVDRQGNVGDMSPVTIGIRTGAHQQIAERLQIPKPYYDRIRENHDGLWETTVNTLFGDIQGNQLFVRTLAHEARAVLSSRYRVIDNMDVIKCVGGELDRRPEKDTVFDRADLTDSSMYLSIRFTKLKDYMTANDDFYGGLLVRNSETGHGSAEVMPRIWRRVCSNGLAIEQLNVRAIHAGKGGSLEEDYNLYNSIQEAIREVIANFGKIADELKKTQTFALPNMQQFLRNVVREFKMTKAQEDRLFIAWGAEQELCGENVWGAVNAITRSAKDSEPDERYELEKIAGRVARMSTSKLEKLALVEDAA